MNKCVKKPHDSIISVKRDRHLETVVYLETATSTHYHTYMIQRCNY